MKEALKKIRELEKSDELKLSPAEIDAVHIIESIKNKEKTSPESLSPLESQINESSISKNSQNFTSNEDELLLQKVIFSAIMKGDFDSLINLMKWSGTEKIKIQDTSLAIEENKPCKMLAALISKNSPEFKSLELTRCQANDQGIIQIFNSLKKNSHISSIETSCLEGLTQEGHETKEYLIRNYFFSKQRYQPASSPLLRGEKEQSAKVLKPKVPMFI